MNKLKNAYIDKMINKKLSSKEIDFILHIAVSQDDEGVVHSVYYKDVCEAIGISIQKFYDIRDSLTEKGLISWKKSYRADISVQLIGNNFSSGNFKVGYLKVSAINFKSTIFRDMKAGAKLLFLYSQRFTNGKHMLVQKFYDDFCKLLKVTQKTLGKYVRELKDNKLLFISKKRNKAMHYEMTMRCSTVLNNEFAYIPNENIQYRDNIKELVRRNYKNNIPIKNPEQVLNDIANLVKTKRAKQYPDYVDMIMQAISDSFEKQRAEGKKKNILNAALVNSCLSDVLERYILEKYNLI